VTAELTPDENALLIAGLGSVGEVVNRGAGRGARIAARGMRADIFQTTVTLALTLSAATETVARVLDSLGRRTAELQAVIGVGVGNLNPAVVTVTVTEDAAGTVAAHVRGVAKEGLIRLRAGEKAARRLIANLPPT
jgi:hypothetical protein